jgi:hypothetical protein
MLLLFIPQPAAASQTLTATAAFTNSQTFYTHVLSQPAAQYARPNADITDGAWTPSTGVDLYAVIDEETASDTDYIVTSAASTCQIGLSPVTDPATSSGQALKYRAQSSTSSTLIARLKQGSTTIATATHPNVPSSWTDYTMNLSAAECDAITNYADLRVELEAA